MDRPVDNSRTQRVLGYAGLAAGIGAFIILCASYFGFTVDDAFISLRYARNVAAGWGFVFNRVGPPVEGYSNFLWIVLEAAVFRVAPAADPIIAAKLFGVAFGVAAVVAVYFFARRLYGPAAGGLAAALVGANAAVPFWAIGGLETTQYLLLLFVALLLSLRIKDGGFWPAGAGVAWCAAALARPDGVVMAAAVLGYIIVSRRGARRAGLLAAAVFAVLYGVYFAWRWHYFGLFLPNTFYARAGIGVRSLASRLIGLWPLVLWVLPAAVLAAWGARRWRKPETGILWVGVVVAMLAPLVAKREWMPGYRYEIPFLGLLAVAAAGALAELLKRARVGVAALALAAGCLYAFLPGVFLYGDVGYGAKLARAHGALGQWLATAAPVGGSLAAWDMGAIPYYADFPVNYDIHPEGLLSTETTRWGYDAAKFIRRKPAFFILFSRRPDCVEAPAGSWVWVYYRSPDFVRDYKYLFTFTYDRDYHLRVYARAPAAVPPAVLARGAFLARATRDGDLASP